MPYKSKDPDLLNQTFQSRFQTGMHKFKIFLERVAHKHLHDYATEKAATLIIQPGLNINNVFLIVIFKLS